MSLFNLRHRDSPTSSSWGSPSSPSSSSSSPSWGDREGESRSSSFPLNIAKEVSNNVLACLLKKFIRPFSQLERESVNIFVSEVMPQMNMSKSHIFRKGLKVKNKESFEKFLGTLKSAQNKRYVEISWSSFFHSLFYLSEEPYFSSSTTTKLIELFSNITMNSRQENQALQNAISYLTRNKLDPFNTLIGLNVTPETIARCLPLSTSVPSPVSLEEMEDFFRAYLSREKVVEEGWTNSHSSWCASFFSRMEPVVPGALILVRDRSSDEAGERENEKHKYKHESKISCVDRRRVRSTSPPMNQNKYKIGRSVALIGSTSVKVNCDLFESAKDQQTVSVDNILTIPSEVLSRSSFSDRSYLHSLFQNPLEELESEVKFIISQYLTQYFRDEGVDMEVFDLSKKIYEQIQEAQNGYRVFPDLWISKAPVIGQCGKSVSRAVRKLRPKDHSNTRLFDPQEKKSASEVLKGIATKCLYQMKLWLQLPSPTLVLADHFLSDQYLSMQEKMNDTILTCAEYWKDMFTHVLKRVEQLLAVVINGDLKDHMIDWWTDRMDQRVDDYLESFGYQLDALPEDFMLNPLTPLQLSVVQSNLDILVSQIDSTSPMVAKTIDFVSEVTEEIYLRVDRLRAEIIDVISVSFTVPLEELTFEKLQSIKKDIDQDDISSRYGLSLEGVRNLIDDLEYLDEMGRMYQDWKEEKEKGQLVSSFVSEAKNRLDVVPIHGLIFANFKTREKNLLLALENQQ